MEMDVQISAKYKLDLLVIIELEHFQYVELIGEMISLFIDTFFIIIFML